MSILAAVDGGPNSDRVIEVGNELASAFDEKLVVIYVLPEESFESRTESAPGYYRDDATEDAAVVASDLVEATLGSTEGTEAIGRIGSPATEILSVADRVEARFIVVGGRRRSPVGKAVFGSDTQEILLKSIRPVVAVLGERDKVDR